jgi:hypothetical protein
MVGSIAKSFQNVLCFVSMPQKLRGLLSLLVQPLVGLFRFIQPFKLNPQACNYGNN